MSDLVLPGIDVPQAAPDASQTDAAPSASVDTPEPAEPLAQSTDAVATDTEAEKEAKGVGKRIKELVAEKHEERRQREKVETQFNLVLQHLLKGQSSEQALQKAGIAPAEAEPKQADFASWDDYVVAKTMFKARQEFRAELASRDKAQQEHQQRTQSQQRAAQQEQAKSQLHNALAGQLSESRAAYPDFDDVVGSATWEIPLNVEAAMTLTGAGGHIAYYLAKNPSVVGQLARLPDMAIANQMARIAHFLKPSANVSNAPPPGRPSGSRGSGHSGYRDDFTPEQHLAWEKRQAKG